MAICTIEKANAAINRLVQQGQLDGLCCVIVDVRPTNKIPSVQPY